MGLKEWLLPPEREFFDLLDKQAGFVLEGAHALRDLVNDFRDVGAKRKHIKDIEHKGDETVHTIYEALNKTFITPIDREDITALASDLDNVLDLVDAAANRMDLYAIPEPSQAMLDFAEVIVEAAAALQKAVGMIRDMKNADLVEKICVEVNRLENVADDLLNTSVAALFQELDVVRILKYKEILERLEAATDYCEDVANVLSDIVAKNR
jgi:predicted phosphate transport protein (TIGR00153 family)